MSTKQAMVSLSDNENVSLLLVRDRRLNLEIPL